MEKSKTPILNLTILPLLFTGLLYIVLISNSSPASLLLPPRATFPACSGHRKSAESPAHEAPPRDDLELALRRASMGNRTVIIAIVNQAYVDPANSEDSDWTMLDLFLESFWLGEGTRKLLDHVLVVALDRTAYMMCRFRRLNCYKLVSDGVDFSGEKLFMSGDFLKMMWRRTNFLTDVLRRGYDFIFTDTDVMWLRNPFIRLSSDETEDLQISTDSFNGDPRSEENYINTGFYFVRSNNRTISLFEMWYSMKDNSTGIKEQDVLVNLMQSGNFKALGLKVRFLDSLYFSGFCTDSRDFGSVSTVHANCCRSIVAKIFDLTAVLRDWKRYRFWHRKSGYARNETFPYKWSNHVGCLKSWGIPINNTLT
ncbi:uncharacterized protein At1g28695-like [Punica granatum]|uniref:Uncharacterized protein At1g28695-like n=1 Tax=Punica granatum TaxID=22663 RepID=A0A218VX94_PUNGR|nr:uncharacterized protein At1g28695-like [Punica granatum]OWM64838.1 hypothetical protein CDL15_Pgr028555 [Punica granatum]